MISSTASTTHIIIDDRGRACVAGTAFRVDQLAIEHSVHGWSAEEIYVQHYRSLTPAQIHAALAFYYDHQAEFDDLIRQDEQAIEEMRAAAGPSPLATRLRREGRIS